MASTIRRAGAIAAVAVLGASLTACGANDSANDDGGGGDSGKKIALLLPETKTTRYEAQDKPLFEAAVADMCDDCEVLYYNADADPAKQQQQVETAISESVDVMVLDPVDGEAAAGLVVDAQDADIPVIAYDRFIEGADYYMSFDNEEVGRLQGESLVEATGGKGDIFMLNGAPTDPNAAGFKSGAHEVIDASDLNIVAEFDNPDWSPEEAQKFTTDQLGNYPPSSIAGVYAANDGQAGGVVAALTGAGLKGNELPPIIGQDAELAAIQRIVAGEQYMTIYKPIKPEAEKAAEVAVMLADGEEITGTEDYEGVPSFIFEPIPVTQDNVQDTVVADGYLKAEDICSSEYADACTKAGVS